MAEIDNTVVVYVTYQGTPEDRFDRKYYVEQHLPLVLKAWGQHGLKSMSAFFPALDQAGTIAICECRFQDAAAITTALGSSDTPGVVADVINFTDLKPVRMRAVAL